MKSRTTLPCLPELLAPAGGLEQLAAAVAAGADAVYLGLGKLNARVSAQGFSVAELAQGCALAHARGVRVYAALNIFLYDSEFEGALHMAEQALACGVDAFIVADLGLIAEMRKRFGEVEIHLSTQAGVHAPEGLALMQRELGIERACVARELSVEEIAELCTTGVPVEVFCHGAICVSYSGACSFSAIRRGRSAMRGDCTQPCRSNYDLVDAMGTSVNATGGEKLICPRDYLGIGHIEELVQAGVHALKIEGRMKNPEYVYQVVRVYREALDCAAAGKSVDVPALTERLAHVFNRGFTDIYLRGTPAGAELMSFERSINQGVRVGQVRERAWQKIYVALDAEVHAGDMLEVRFYPGEHTAPDAPKRWPQLTCPVDAHAGETIFVHCKRKVEVGSEVYLTKDAQLVNECERAVAALLAEAPLPNTAAIGEFEDVREKPERLVETMEGASPAAGAVVLEEMLRRDNRATTLTAIESAKQSGAEVVCRNIAQVELCRAAGARFAVAKPIFCSNTHTEELLRSWGAEAIYMADPTRQLMVMEHCVLTAEGPCSHACATCERRKQERYLIEQDGGRVRIEVDEHGRSRLYQQL